MKVSEQIKKTEEIVYFKNLVIAFGVCLGFLAFTSSDTWSRSSSNADEYTVSVIATSSDADQSKELKSANGDRTFTHYNFLASYLIQESSISRQSKENKEKGNFLANLKQIHKIIISNTLGGI